MMNNWPKQSECIAFYGNPRHPTHTDQADAAWERNNLIRIAPPFQLKFGTLPVAGVRLHRHCAQAMLAWLNAVKDNAGGDLDKIETWGMTSYSGAYNFRLMRGLKSLSMHSFGCAIDFDVARNGLGDKTPNFATLRKQVISPFLDFGGLWGGDWNGNGSSADERRCDGMHFQFARLG